jgi:pyridinium-3,5-biscarboxylic acid mononucleotide synthase
VSTHRTADLGFARLDLDRARRTGTPEVVYAAGKTPAQTVACLEGLRDGGAAMAWATRVDDATAAAVLDRWPDAVLDTEARCVFVGEPPEPVGHVLVLTAGTSDGPVAAEVAARAASAAAASTTSAWRACTGCSRWRPTSPRPTPSWWWPAWTARCPAWWRG